MVTPHSNALHRLPRGIIAPCRQLVLITIVALATLMVAQPAAAASFPGVPSAVAVAEDGVSYSDETDNGEILRAMLAGLDTPDVSVEEPIDVPTEIPDDNPDDVPIDVTIDGTDDPKFEGLVAGILRALADDDPAPQAHDPWLAVRICESTNTYDINTGNGFYGAYQFTIRSWDWVAGIIGRTDLVGLRPDLATPADQDRMANALAFEVAGGGLSHWPVCGKKYG